MIDQLDIEFDSFPSKREPLIIQHAPVRSVSVGYLDGDGNPATIPSANYRVTQFENSIEITLADNMYWPRAKFVTVTIEVETDSTELTDGHQQTETSDYDPETFGDSIEYERLPD